MKIHHIFFTILTMLFVASSSPTLRAQCMPNASIQPGFSSVFPGGISSFGVVGPNANGDFLIVGNAAVPAIQTTLSLLPLPNAVNQQFCDTITVTPGALYFSYVPTPAERAGDFSAFATQLAGVPGVTGGQFSLDGSFWGWRIPAQSRTRTVVSEDPNFTPSVLASELSGPAGIVFRPQPVDLVVAQFGVNAISLVNATGAVSAFANQNAPADVAVRASDGVVAVNSVPMGQVAGPIDFYSSAGSPLGSITESVVLTAARPFIPAETTNMCIAGIAFDAGGNLFVAAGPGTAVVGGCAPGNAWAIYQFPGPTPWTALASQVSVVATGLSQLAGLIFSAAPLPSGALYATSNTTGAVYQFLLGNGDPIIATVPTTINDSGNPIPDLASIAQDPLVGYLYIAEFLGGNILRIPPGGGTPTAFATGFSNTFGLSFDSNGNLYVTEYNTGAIWTFKRESFATQPQPIIQGQTNSLTFVNPDAKQSDQKQTIFIPASANFCDPSGRCAAFVRDVFVDVDPATLDATLAPGSPGDTAFFGGTSVPPGTTCVIVPSAKGCLAIVQQCFDANGKAFDICPVQEPSGSTDLIQLATEYTAPSLPPNLAFLIAHDSLSDYTDITMGTSTDATGSGGSKGLCSKTVLASLGPTTGPDFSLSPISPITLSLGESATLHLDSNHDGKEENEHGTECELRKRRAKEREQAERAVGRLAGAIRGEESRGDGDGCRDESPAPTVTVNSINGFISTVNLGLADVPTGVSALFGTTPTTSLTPPSNGSVSSILNISLGPSVTPSMFTLIVTGNAPPSPFNHLTSVSVTVSPTTSGVSTVIGKLLTSGCIDNAGIANALTSKLSAAERAIDEGEVQKAINILTAFQNQVRAQTGKHIATSCTIGGITFNPADALLIDAQSLIDSL